MSKTLARSIAALEAEMDAAFECRSLPTDIRDDLWHRLQAVKEKARALTRHADAADDASLPGVARPRSTV